MRENAYPERGQAGIGLGGLIPSLSLVKKKKKKNAVVKEVLKKKR